MHAVIISALIATILFSVTMYPNPALHAVVFVINQGIDVWNGTLDIILWCLDVIDKLQERYYAWRSKE